MARFITLREFKEALARDERPDAAVRKQVATETRQVDVEELTVDFVISTASRDRENDTIRVGGWETAAYMANPVVLWVHDHGAPPVAQAQSLTITDDALMARARFTPREISPFGFMIFQMYAERFLRATSVGFIPLEWVLRRDDEGMGVDFARQELLEFSCVPVPANPEALALARGKGIDLVPLRTWAEEVLDAWDERKAEVALPRKRVESLRKQVLEVVGPLRLSLTEQLALGKRNLAITTKPRIGRDGPGSGNSGIQTLIFGKDSWTVAQAKEWASEHDFYQTPVDETENSVRIRQFDPDRCRDGSFQTLTEGFPGGVSAVQCTGKALVSPAARDEERMVLEVEGGEPTEPDGPQGMIPDPDSVVEGLYEYLRASFSGLIKLVRAELTPLNEALVGVRGEVNRLGRPGEALDAARTQLDKAADRRAKETREELAGAFGRLVGDVKTLAEEMHGLRSGVELNVERKLLDFETSVEAKTRALLDGHLTEARAASEAGGAALLAGIEGEVKRQLDAALDRFKDYYSGRQADYEARAEQRAERVGARLQDVQQVLLRAVSKLDQAVKLDQTSEGLQNLGEQLSLFGEVLRELVDVLGKLTEEENDGITVEPDGGGEEPVALELDVSGEELESGVRAAVGDSFKRLVAGEIGRRLDQIRGRLED